MIKLQKYQNKVKNLFWHDINTNKKLINSESDIPIEIMRQVYEISNDGLIFLNSVGDILQVNIKAVEILGIGKEKLLGKKFIDLGLFSIKDISDILNLLGRINKTKKNNLNLWITNHQHKKYFIEFSTARINKFILIKLRDKTKQKIAEDYQKIQQNHLEELFDKSPDAKLLLNENEVIIKSNVAFTKLFGYMPDIVGKKPNDIIVPDRFLNEASDLSNKITEGNRIEIETIRKKKNGQEVNVSVLGNPIKFGNRYYIYAIYHDITKRIQAEQRIQKINECLVSLTEDYQDNINLIIKTCGELLNATYALYNKLSDSTFNVQGQWQMPVDYVLSDNVEGHICNDVIHNFTDKVFVINNLLNSEYAKTDQNVAKYGLQTYMGCTVKCREKNIGNICVVYKNNYIPTDEEKKILSIFASAIKVEEDQKISKEKIIESESRFRDISYSIGDLIWEVDKDGYITYCSEKSEEIFGCSREDAYGKLFLELLIPYQKEKIASVFKSLISEGKKIKDYEYWSTNQNGKLLCISANAVPILDKNNKYKGYRGVCKNITKRKRAEYAIKESNQRFKNIWNSSPEALTVTSLSGNILDCNQASLDLYNYIVKEEILGKNILDLIVEREKKEAIINIEKILKNGSIKDVSHTILTKDEKEFKVKISSNIIYDSEGNPSSLVNVIKKINKLGE